MNFGIGYPPFIETEGCRQGVHGFDALKYATSQPRTKSFPVFELVALFDSTAMLCRAPSFNTARTIDARRTRHAWLQMWRAA
jgi:hypothetical protein